MRSRARSRVRARANPIRDDAVPIAATPHDDSQPSQADRVFGEEARTRADGAGGDELHRPVEGVAGRTAVSREPRERRPAGAAHFSDAGIFCLPLPPLDLLMHSLAHVLLTAAVSWAAVKLGGSRALPRRKLCHTREGRSAMSGAGLGRDE